MGGTLGDAVKGTKVNRQKKAERKERGHDKIILPPSGISRQWPFPALTNSLRDSTETISTIAHTQPRSTDVLSRTRISSTDFLLFSSSVFQAAALPFLLSLSFSRSLSRRYHHHHHREGVNSPSPVRCHFWSTTTLRQRRRKRKSSRARALHAALPHTTRAPSSLFQHVYRISGTATLSAASRCICIAWREPRDLRATLRESQRCRSLENAWPQGLSFSCDYCCFAKSCHKIHVEN